MIATQLMRRLGNGSARNPIEAFRREMDNWLSSDWAGGQGDLVGSYPVDIREDQDFIHVQAELPGFKKDEIEVTLENGILTIQAQRKVEEEDKKGQSHLAERRFTRVARAFTLPNSVHGSDVEASLSDGVLYLKLHKREEVKPRKIEVK